MLRALTDSMAEFYPAARIRNPLGEEEFYKMEAAVKALYTAIAAYDAAKGIK